MFRGEYELKRPVIWFSLIWVLGAYLALVDGRSWLFFIVSLFFILWLLLPHLIRLPRQMCLYCILIFVVSVGYNLWFDVRNITSLSLAFTDKLLLSGNKINLQGKIDSPVEVDGDRVSFVVKANRLQLEGQSIHDISESIQIFIRLTTESEQSIVHQWQRGDYIKLSGSLKRPDKARNFGMFDYQKYLYLQHIHWVVDMKGISEVHVSRSNEWSVVHIHRWSDSIRDRLGSKVDAIFSQQYSGYMKSLLIGLRDDLQPEQFTQFSQIGLTHIIAISGLHVAIFIAGCMGLMKCLGITRETNLFIMMLLIPLYVLLTGAAPSVVRAGLMAIIALYASRRNQLKDGLHIISIVGTGMLIWHPYYLFDISFQLSFIVTIGLIISVPILNRLLPISSEMIKGTISVTTAAQLFSFPLSIYYFNQFSLLSWLANLFLVPLISLCILPLGMAALLISFIYEQFGMWIASFIDLANTGIFFVIERLNEMKKFHMIWKSPSHTWVIIYFSLLLIALWSISKNRYQRRFPLFLTMGTFVLLLIYGYYPEHLNQAGKVQFLDVGQGDSILIQTPSNQTILMDGGGTLHFQKQENEWKNRNDPYEVGKDLVVPLLKQRGIQHIDFLIISHLDMDHIGGLQAVLEYIPVRRILFNGTFKDAENVEKLFTTALQYNIPLYITREGKHVDVDSNTRLTFLYPDFTEELVRESDQNNASVVCLLEMYDSTFLLTGDIDTSSEHELLERISKKPLAAVTKRSIDVLKIAHHGSKNSTSEEWLDYWKPKVSVISAGRNNSYGHPNPQVIERLTNSRIDVYRTDLHGEVQMEVNQNTLKIRSKTLHK